jgi:hypothetical protein
VYNIEYEFGVWIIFGLGGTRHGTFGSRSEAETALENL